MKNKLLLILSMNFFIISLQQLNAQNSVSGTIKDTDGMLLESANVMLLKSVDSSLVKGTLSDASGKYSFENIKNGPYLITATFTGMKQVYSEPFELNGDKKEIVQATIYLQKSGTQLSEVTIVAKKPLFEQKIDRMVINVRNSLTNAGGTALDVLEKSPGVTVNRQNNRIALNGKNGVVVMINGKINYMPINALVQMLAATSSDNIEKIELITTPPSKYDAEGNAGYINIVLINNPYAGFSGAYFFSAGYGKKESGDGGVNFNYRSAKINWYGDYSFTHSHNLQPSTAYTQFSGAADIITSRSFSNRDATRDIYNIRTGLDYRIDTANAVGILIGGYISHWTMDANNGSFISRNNKPDSSVKTFNREINHWQNITTNLNFQHTFKPGKLLYIDANYVYYKNSNPNTYLNTYYNNAGELINRENLKSGKITPINFKIFSADYTTPIGSKISMEAGAKLSVSRFSNNVDLLRLKQDIYIADSSSSANYLLKENIGAAYTSISIIANSKLSIKAGLRYEYTRSDLRTVNKANLVNRKYGEFFPTFYVAEKLNDKNNISISYSRRITRPAFTDLAPFTIFFDPKTFFTGNTALQPAIANAVQVSYSLKNYSLSLSYTHEQNTIENFYFQTQKIDTLTNILYLSASNFKYEQYLSASLSLPFTINKCWSMQNNIIYSLKQINTTNETGPVRLNTSNYSINSTQRFILPANFSAEFTAFYYSKGYFGTTKFKPLYQLNAGLQKTFSNKKDILRLAANDIFNSGGNLRLEDNSIKAATIKRNFSFGLLAYRLTYTHNFGNNVLKNKRERSTGAEDELRRVHN